MSDSDSTISRMPTLRITSSELGPLAISVGFFFFFFFFFLLLLRVQLVCCCRSRGWISAAASARSLAGARQPAVLARA